MNSIFISVLQQMNNLNDSHRFKECEWYSDSADFAVVIWSIFSFVKSKQSHPYIS